MSEETAVESSESVDAEVQEMVSIMQAPRLGDAPWNKGEEDAEELEADAAEDTEVESAEEDPEGVEATAEGDKKGDAASEGDDTEAPEGSAASGWAKVKKREMRVQRQLQELKQSQQQMEQLKAKLDHQEKAVNEFREKIQKNPLKALEEAGYTFETLAKQVLADGAPPQQAQQAQKVDPQMQQLTEMVKGLQERLDSREAAIEQMSYRSQAESVLQHEDYATLAAYEGAADEIVNFQRNWKAQNGESLTAAQAAGKLQAAWEGQLRKMAENPAVKRLLLGESAKQSDGPSEAPVKKAQKGSATLTNKMASAPIVEDDDAELTEQEEIALALKKAGLA